MGTMQLASPLWVFFFFYHSHKENIVEIFLTNYDLNWTPDALFFWSILIHSGIF